MPLPNIYRRGSPNLIASFDFTDVATGRGYKVFYAGDYRSGVSGAGLSYALADTPWYSPVGITSINTGTITRNFDLVWGKNVKIGGDAIINIPWKMVTATTPPMISGAVWFQVVSGASVVDLAHGDASESGVADNTYHIFGFKVNIPKTTIKNGETLRLKFMTQADNGSNCIFFHDPKGRTTINSVAYTGMESTQFTAAIPFVIEE